MNQVSMTSEPIVQYCQAESNTAYCDAVSPSVFTLSCPISQFQKLNPQCDSSFDSFVFSSCDNYKIVYNDLIGPKVSLIHRFKILRWLQNQSNNYKHPRGVFAYTCYYLDLYFQKNSPVRGQNVQLIALGAMLIATKIEGAQFPQIGGQLSKEQIFAAELKICLSLQYLLNPKTYIYYLDLITQKWDQFVDANSISANQKYLVKSVMAFKKTRSLHQKMEFVNMVGESLKFELGELVLNLFYIQNKISYQQIDTTKMELSELEQLIDRSYDGDDSYHCLFQSFLKFCRFPEYGCQYLEKETGLYLAKYILIPIDQSPPARRCLNYQVYLKMQTVSPAGVQQLEKMVRAMK